MKRWGWGHLLLGGFVLVGSSPAQVLTLEKYLEEVTSKHEGVRAMLENADGALFRMKEGDLMTTPQAFVNLQVADDKKPQANPAFSGTETTLTGYSVGVMQQTRFGLSAKLSYNMNYIRIAGTNPMFLPVPDFYEVGPKIEVNQSLWRNGFGSETRKTMRLAEASAKATHHGEKFKAKVILAEAEGVYWGLVLQRELVEAQKESLERAKKIRAWNLKRSRFELADKSDLLQSEAGVRGGSLELQVAEDELAATERSFNRLRGMSPDPVKEPLEKLDREELEKLKPPTKKGVRGDVQAALELKNLTEANAELGSEKSKPNLDVYGAVALNGRGADYSVATTDSLGTNYPTIAVGLKFSTPLDFGLLGSNQAGYIREQHGAELNYRRKLFEETQDWNELLSRFEDAKRRLKLSREMEAVQNEKLENERGRLRKGQSVTYQVVLFEQDYATAQTLRLRTESDILRLMAQMKMFGD